jgi:hypothetical protein
MTDVAQDATGGAVKAFVPTVKQDEALDLLGSEAMYLFLYGGSRSGKTFIWIYAMCMRAVKAPGSRHCALRFRSNAIKQSIVMDTFPKVMQLCFPAVKYQINHADMFARLANKSEIWFGGLDDKERVEKILGNEYATIGFNEVSQIPYQSILMALTRLAQKCSQVVNGVTREMPLKAYFDANPPTKGHWSYKAFKLKQDPITGMPIKNGHLYASMQMNPHDNHANLNPAYLDQLEAMPEHMKRRFLYGEFGDDNPFAIFSELSMDTWRHTGDVPLPDMVRLVVAVDPSGSNDEDTTTNDAVGIVVAGLGTNGIGYLLEDLTVKAGPATWGRVACEAFDRWRADVIVAETNFGGEMVRYTIRSINPRATFRKVTASRGKVQRAEPLSPLVETGKIRFAGYFPELEEELLGFSTRGYTGNKSPNRADAFVWGFTELFPSITRPSVKRGTIRPTRAISGSSGSWMA